MYPFYRMTAALIRAKFRPMIEVEEVFRTHHRIMPWDIDLFGELNNGTTLSILDLNRLPFGDRVGWNRCLMKNKWAMTMAGVSVRYRRRIRAFMRVEITSQAVGRDARFFYLVQNIYHKGEAMTQALYRVAITDRAGIVAPEALVEALDRPDWNPKMPKWVTDWIHAEQSRPWPPQESL